MAIETELEQMVIRLVGDARQYTAMLAEQERATKSFARRIETQVRNVGQSFTRLGKSLSLRLTVPLTALGVAAIKVGSDFESGFAGVRKTVNATEEEFEALERSFEQLSIEIPVDTSKLLEIGEIAGQLGIRKENIISFTDTIAKLGATTNLAGEEGATQLARFANIVGLSQDKFSNLASSLVALGNSAGISSGALATTEAEIATMSLRLAGAGRQIGLTAPQITGLAATLSALGLRAEAGGTAFSKLFIDLQVAVARGGDDLEAFARVARMTTTEFADLFRRDAMAAVTNLMAGINSFGSNAGLALESMGIESTRAIDALLRGSKNVPLLTEAIASSTKAFAENTALAAEAEQRFKTFGSFVILLKNQIKLLLKDAFKVMRPVLIEIGEAVQVAVGWFRGLNDESKRMIVVAAAVAASLGPLLIGLGILTGSLGAIIGLMGTLAAAVSFVLSPVVILTGAIAALGAAVVHWSGVGGAAVTWFGQQWARLKDFIQPAIDGITDALRGGDIKLALEIGWVQIKIVWLTGIRSLQEAWVGFVKFFKTIWVETQSGFTSTWNNTVTGMQNRWLEWKAFLGQDISQDVVKLAFDDAARRRGTSRSAALKRIDDEAAASMNAIRDSIRGLEGERDILARQATKLAIEAIKKTAEGAADGIAAVTDSAFDDMPQPPPIELGVDASKVDSGLRDAAASVARFGSAEAFARIAEFQAGAGSLERAAPRIPPAQVVAPGLSPLIPQAGRAAMDLAGLSSRIIGDDGATTSPPSGLGIKSGDWVQLPSGGWAFAPPEAFAPDVVASPTAQIERAETRPQEDEVLAAIRTGIERLVELGEADADEPGVTIEPLNLAGA